MPSKYGNLSKGDVREDGKLFVQYVNGYEMWATREHFEIIRQAKNLEARKRRDNNRWRAANSAYCKEYYKNHKEANAGNNRAKSGAYYRANKDVVLAKQMAKYYIPEIGDKIRQRQRLANRTPSRRSAMAAKAAKRRMIKLKTPVEETHEIKFLYSLCQALNSGGVKHHVDHIIPISKGGNHSASNLRIVPAIVNLRKGAKPLAA